MKELEIRRRMADATLSAPGLDPLLARIYANRGVTTATELDLSLSGLLRVGSLDGVDAAVDLLTHHRREGGRVVIVGDFDADGATSTALMMKTLQLLGFGNVSYLVPNRFDYGYGLTPEIVDLAARRDPGLIVTVDNGISSHDGVDAARRRGIDVLVTDHHLPGAELPDANAIVNPNAPGNGFFSKNLAGVGVAFYLMAALSRAIGQTDTSLKVTALLDLVALGTVADVVPLDRNNRILVAAGLKRICAGRSRPGVEALLAEAGRDRFQCTATDLAFGVAPRLNAAGRLEDMSIGIECLLTDDPPTARRLARQLSALNRERRDIEARMQQDAAASLDRIDMDSAAFPSGVCLFDESWHQGIVGLVASRMKERVHRPVIAFARADAEHLKGSARSVPGLHIRDTLDTVAARNPGLVKKFGGHAMAAGLTLRDCDFDRFSEVFDAQVRERTNADDLRGVHHTDGELSAADLTLRTAENIRAGGPWGQGFPEPTFDGRFEVLAGRIVGEDHLKLRVSLPGAETPLDAIAFRQGDALPPNFTGPVEMVYKVDVNDYMGVRRPQLVVEYLAPLEGQNR